MAIRFSISVLAITLMFFAFSAHAEINSSDIVLDISPNYPAPNQSVTATLTSFVTDINKAYISWSVNGKEALSGVGKKTFSFSAGGVNTTSTLEANIQTFNGPSVVKRAGLAPAGLDLLWQAPDSYAPPFYKGKIFAGTEGTFKVVAMPNLATNSANLTYVWTKDNNGAPDSSGWGKNYFIFKNNYLEKDNTVGVAISDVSGNTNATGTITLQTVPPTILFYKKDPTLGIKYEQAIENGSNINKNGETLVAEPYFFSTKNINSTDLTFDWSINGQTISTPSPKNILSIKPSGGKAGQAFIKVGINNARTLFQNLEKQINVSF